MLGDVMITLLHGGEYTKALEVMKKESSDSSITGTIPLAPLQLLHKSAVEKKDAEAAMVSKIMVVVGTLLFSL